MTRSWRFVLEGAKQLEQRDLMESLFSRGLKSCSMGRSTRACAEGGTKCCDHSRNFLFNHLGRSEDNAQRVFARPALISSASCTYFAYKMGLPFGLFELLAQRGSHENTTSGSTSNTPEVTRRPRRLNRKPWQPAAPPAPAQRQLLVIRRTVIDETQRKRRRCATPKPSRSVHNVSEYLQEIGDVVRHRHDARVRWRRPPDFYTVRGLGTTPERSMPIPMVTF